MKTITTYQLEAGDVLYYVHKPDDQYVVDEIVGDKNGIVTKIEFGTRKHTYRPLGLPVLTTEKSFVKVHLKPKNPADRKAIENLLDGKN